MSNKKLKQVLAFSITIAVILLYILHFSTVIIAFSNEWLKYLLLAILGLFITVILASLVHELGHIICGLILGFKIDYLSILFIKFTFAKKFKISLIFPFEFGETGLTPKNSKNYPDKIVACAISGLIGSLIYMLFGMLVATTTSSIETFVVFGLSYHLSAYIFLINLLPLSSTSDGELLFSKLFKKDRDKVIFNNALQLGADISLGVNPQDVDGELLKFYDESGDKYSMQILYFRYLSYFPNDDIGGFKQLDKIKDLNVLEGEEYIAVLKEKFFKALVLKEQDFIEKYQEEVVDYLSEYSSPSDYRIHATYRIYQGEYEWAKLIINDGLNNIDNFSIKGLVKLEKSILKSMLLDENS